MKKYLALVGAGILVMALAFPAMAQFSSWGHLEIQTIWEKQPDFNQGGSFFRGSIASPGSDTTWRHVAERYRFYLAYGDPKTVRAVLGFEADSQDWGEPASGTVTGGRMGVYATDQVQLEVKHAYVEFVVPNTPLQVIAGLQGFAYGGRILINNDAPGVTLRANFAPHTMDFAWIRMNDQDRNTYTVNDLYILDWKMAQKAYNVNAYFAYLNDLWTGHQASFTDREGTTTPIINQFDEKPILIGVNGGFRPGNWDFFAHGGYVFGKREFKAAGVSDSDYAAWYFEAYAKYRIGPGMFAQLEYFYTTGNDADDPDKIKYFPTAKSSEARSIFGNDRTVFFWMNAAQMGYYHDREIDFSGMWYGRFAFEYSPTAWVRMILNYLYIGDTSKGSPGTFIPKVNPTVTRTKVVNSPKGSQQGTDEDFVGHEINLITTLNIYKGFVYNIGIYYFIPGEVWDTPTRSADASYGINTKLIYAF